MSQVKESPHKTPKPGNTTTSGSQQSTPAMNLLAEYQNMHTVRDFGLPTIDVLNLQPGQGHSHENLKLKPQVIEREIKQIQSM